MALTALNGSSLVGSKCSLSRSTHQPRRLSARRILQAPKAQLDAPDVKPPKGVTQPPVQPTVPPAIFGFVENAERMNSRAAMIGFFALLAVEAIANKGLLEMVGLTVGSGLGFEL